MEDWSIELAKLFKERNNIDKLGALVGEVVEVIETEEENKKNYTKISLLKGSIFIDKFKSIIKNFYIDDIGKKLLVVASDNNQQFFVVGYIEEFTGERS